MLLYFIPTAKMETGGTACSVWCRVPGADQTLATGFVRGSFFFTRYRKMNEPLLAKPLSDADGLQKAHGEDTGVWSEGSKPCMRRGPSRLETFGTT